MMASNDWQCLLTGKIATLGQGPSRRLAAAPVLAPRPYPDIVTALGAPELILYSSRVWGRGGVARAVLPRLSDSRRPASSPE